MPYTYILDDSILYILDDSILKESDSDSDSWSLDSPISPGFLYKIKNFFFSSVGEPLHDHGHMFEWPSPF